MKRVMIMGQPGSGKSTLARRMGDITGLPVFHMDHIHWQPGWRERPLPEKIALARAIEAQERWIFEGGLSSTYASRAARADLIVWLDVPVGLRLWRVTRRCLTGLGRTRPDLPENCPETLRNLPGFWRFIWDTRHTATASISQALAAAPPGVSKIRLTRLTEVRAFLDGLK
ncbi:AAA family ATPase [Ruixingdingia sedimenti]|uniref:AAA family ATPase n=1 Tax=Ruixingdingia sedimenti TaxID=3073604 RepID=A0ABU1F5C5_9RHOB|nr:AAA family ATPase [Xinfangfangia sp. LG-4]MDR5652077.1 AAA family ATPase [Xinfangfangia sp. LG-4]